MRDRKTGWTGKRLFIDLSVQRSWTEEIPDEDLRGSIGGRGLNSLFFSDRVDGSLPPSSPENPVAFAVGPLSGTLTPCSGWTSVSTLSPVPDPPKYGHTSLPGHWGPQLKFTGFDQLIIRGKAEKPVFLAIEEETVRFKEAKHLWGKDTVETTVAVQKEMKDRNVEVLCIGPAGENGVTFANVTNRLSWTGDHIGLGYVFGSKNLKALAVHGNRPVNLYDPERFLQLCLTLRERIHRDPVATRLREEGPFYLLKQNGKGLGIRNYNESSRPERVDPWRTAYLARYLYGKEGCFSCPIHCGRISEVDGNFFGGVHLESAWSLGPRIGIDAWEKTLLLHRICQLQGLDPVSTGSLLSWIMDCAEKGILLARELEQVPCRWGDEKSSLQMIELIVEKKGIGEILGQGGLRAAGSLGQGLERVSHFRGMDLPARDPRSSMDYALSRALFPMHWDYLQSLTNDRPSSGNSQENEPNRTLKEVWALEEQRILADLNGLCPLVVARLSLLSKSDIGELLSAATGEETEDETLTAAVVQTVQSERILWQKSKSERPDPFPLRFFSGEEEKRRFEKAIVNLDALTYLTSP